MALNSPVEAPPALVYPRRLAIRRMLRASIALVFATLTDFHVIGRENLPPEGPLLVVANHFHFLDPLAIIHSLPYPLEFLGGKQAPNAPGVFAWTRNVWGILPVRRGSSSRDALLNAQRLLDQKAVLGVFPEGGSWASVLRPPRPGAALLAARSSAPILPIGLGGLGQVFPSLAKRRRARVTVQIGRPFGPYNMDARDRSARQAMDEIGHEMMRRIAELIPPEQRGFYSADPTIRAAARGTEIYPWDAAQEG